MESGCSWDGTRENNQPSWCDGMFLGHNKHLSPDSVISLLGTCCEDMVQIKDYIRTNFWEAVQLHGKVWASELDRSNGTQASLLLGFMGFGGVLIYFSEPHFFRP